jgi:hypothetical protein
MHHHPRRQVVEQVVETALNLSRVVRRITAQAGIALRFQWLEDSVNVRAY